MRPARPRSRPLRRGALFELLLRLYAYGPAPIAGADDARRAFRLARYALARELVELADGFGPLERGLTRRMRRIRLAPRGRARLGVPEPAPRGERSELSVIRSAVAFFLGDVLAARLSSDGGVRVHVHHDTAAHDAEVRVVACTRLATEQGVRCVPVFDTTRSASVALLGFDRVCLGER